MTQLEEPMILVIDTRGPIPVYVQIMEQVRRLVRDRSLAPGTPLPSVRQVAADLELNPNTVAKAYMLLEKEGTVRTVPRRGTFVGPARDGEGGPGMEQRVEETVDRFLREAERLGLDRNQLVSAVLRRTESESTENDQ